MDIRYFLGANSAGGFYSRYDQLLPRTGTSRLRILKGGSGCGKSTLMNKVAAHADQLGLTVHRILCSSDPDSLDGVLIPEVQYAVVDGTAPHVVEPELCGCGERYIDLGEGYNSEGLMGCRHILQSIRQANRSCYPKVTSCLRMAAALEPHAAPEFVSLTPQLAEELRERELPVRGGMGSCRTVFLSGHTPKGYVTCWSTVSSLCTKVYALQGIRSEIGGFLAVLRDAAVERGWDCMLCDSPLLPDRYAEHLLIPGLGLAFVTDAPHAPCPLPAGHRLGVLPEADGIQAAQQSLLREAIGHLRRAGEYHRLLETAYEPFTDFTPANRAALDCCAELEVLAQTMRT